MMVFHYKLLTAMLPAAILVSQNMVNLTCFVMKRRVLIIVMLRSASYEDADYLCPDGDDDNLDTTHQEILFIYLSYPLTVSIKSV